MGWVNIAQPAQPAQPAPPDRAMVWCSDGNGIYLGYYLRGSFYADPTMTDTKTRYRAITHWQELQPPGMPA